MPRAPKILPNGDRAPIDMADRTEYENSLDFLEASGALARPGDPNRYLVPREVGSSPTDVTSFVPGQQWSLDNLPNILYYIKPPPGWADYKKKRIYAKRDASGLPVLERWPRPGKPRKALFDYPCLPDQIGTMEHPLMLLAWRRLEPSATWDDFLVRMEDGPSKPAKGNVLSMRISRMMDDFSIISTWHGTKDWSRPSKDQQRRLAKISLAAQGNNTTRGFTPGLVDPSRGEAGGRVPLPKMAEKSCEGRGHAWSSRVSGPTPAARKAAEADEESDSDSDLSSLSTITDISSPKSESHGSLYESHGSDYEFHDSEYLESVSSDHQSSSAGQSSSQDREATPVLRSSDTQSSALSDNDHEPYPGVQPAFDYSHPSYWPGFSMKHEPNSELHSFEYFQRRVETTSYSSPSERYPPQHQNRFLPQQHDRFSYSQGARYQPYPTSGTAFQRQQRFRPDLRLQIPDIQQIAPRLDYHAQTYRASPSAQSFSNRPGPVSSYSSMGYNNQPRYAGFPSNFQQSFDNRAFADPRTYHQAPYYEPRQNYQESHQDYPAMGNFAYAAFPTDYRQNDYYYPSPS
ncbi:hypothetical protein G7Y79_00021g050080 [Physcia stellaris]|nr:hypothetical protein G7Y79_00021g050080 [Physcia stellaris]